MKKWKHEKLMTHSYFTGEKRGYIREVPESDYKKIMAVYRAAVKLAEEKDTYDADDYYRLYKAVERAEMTNQKLKATKEQ